MKTITFNIEKRRNVHCKNHTEWALNFRAGLSSNQWTMISWEKKPTELMVQDAITLIRRAFAYYHDHLVIPPIFMDIRQEE